MADDLGLMPDVLARICTEVRADIDARKAKRGIEALRHEIGARHNPTRGFGYALKQASAAGRYGLIAEIKKASPSGGRLHAEQAFTDRFIADSDNLGKITDYHHGRISLREVLVHMIEEYARHNGHADLLRERVDGRLGE